MKQGKRFLAIAVALFLAVGLLGIPVFADGEDPEVKEFKITYHANNGGVDEPWQEDAYQGEDSEHSSSFATIEKTGFEYPGYMFLEWNTKSDGTGEPYQEGESVLDIAGDPGDNFDLYAKWSPYYLISYQPNYGDGSIPAAIVGPFTIKDEDIDPFQIEDPAELGFSNSGNLFTGWNTKKDGSGETYTPGQNVTENLTKVPGKIVQLYAQWQAVEKTYTVVYHSNNSSQSVTLSRWYEYGDEGSETGKFQIPDVTEREFVENDFAKEGSVFTGWNTKADGSGVDYYPGEEVQNLGEITLYAQWAEKFYLVSYQPNYGDGSIPAAIVGPFSIGDPGTSFQIEDPEELGYRNAGFRFIGWNTKKDGSGTNYQAGADVYNLSMVSGKIVQLYAQWEAVEGNFYVRYQPNFESETINSYEEGPFAIGETVTIDKNDYMDPAHPDYVFVCWNTKADGTGTDYYPGDKVSDLTKQAGTIVDLYAKWNANYIISYNPNNGDGRIPAALVEYKVGSKAKLEEIEDTGFERIGYEFLGWNTKADGTGTAYKGGQTVNSLANKPGVFVSLYAQWKPYYVTAYNPNNGNSSLPSMLIGPCYLGGKYKIASIGSTGFTKNGYQFIGWNTKANGTGIMYKAGQTVTNLSSKPGTFVQLYAQWKPKAKNTMTVTPKSKTIKKAKLKKSAKKFTIKVKKAKGKVTFTLNKAAKKAKIKVTSNGVVTIPKKCKAGKKYRITVKAAGNDGYNPATATVKIIVK